MLLLACGTHPSAVWSRQRATEASRYDELMRDLQMLGSRNQLCGLHVHVEVQDADERIRLMARILPFLPLLLALSTSSPFWQGRRTGLMGYRLCAYAELPRTGLPDLFTDPADYRAYVEALVGGRRDQGCKLYLVGDPPLGQASDARAAHRRQLHAPRRYAGHRRPLSLPRAPSAAQAEAECRPDRGLARHRGREHLARPALRHPWRPGLHGKPQHAHGAGASSTNLSTQLAEDAAALGCAAELAACRGSPPPAPAPISSSRSSRRRASAPAGRRPGLPPSSTGSLPRPA